MLKVGSGVKLISVPEFYKEDLFKNGTVTKLYNDSHGTPIADVLLDGDEGVCVCFCSQLVLLGKDDEIYIKLSDLLKAIDNLPNCKNGQSDVYDKATIVRVVENLEHYERGQL